MSTTDWREKYTRFALGLEATSYGVLAAAFQVVDMDIDLPPIGNRVQDTGLRATQFGGGVKPVLGGKDTGGSFEMRWVADGFVGTYDGTSDVPGTDAGVVGITPVLIGWALGSNAAGGASHANFFKGGHLSAAAYDATDVASATTAAITTKTGTFTAGQLAVAGLAVTDPAAWQTGWISTQSAPGGPGDVLTLQRASENAAPNDSDMYPSVTAWLASCERESLSLRFTGEAAESAFDVYGLKPASGFMDWKAGEVPVCGLTVEFTSWAFDDTGALGGLSEPAAFTQLPDISGSNAGRVIIDGTAAALADFRLDFECTPHQEQNHSEVEGVSRRVMDFVPTISFAQRRDTADSISGGRDIWRQRWKASTPVDVQLDVGDTPGAGMSMLAPQWIVMEEPTMEWIDGLLYNRIVIGPYRYTADTGSTAPADTTLRVGWW